MNFLDPFMERVTRVIFMLKIFLVSIEIRDLEDWVNKFIKLWHLQRLLSPLIATVKEFCLQTMILHD